MSAYSHVHSRSTRWLMKGCRLLLDDQWPVDIPLTFDGLDHEEDIRDEAACIFFEAASSWGKAKKIAIKNVCLSVKCKAKLEALLEASPLLESMTMTKISTSDGGMHFLSRSLFSSNKEILELTIDACMITRQEAILLQRILGVGSLRVLNLRNIDLGETIPLISSRLSHCTSLRNLDLSGSRMNHKALLAMLQCLESNTSLETLILQNCGVGSSEGTAIDNLLSANSHLKALDLGRNDICGATIELLARSSLSSNETLRKIVLSHNPIGDAGAFALTDLLTSKPTLESLSVIDCDIWRPGCISLASGLARMQGLRHLLVDGEMEELADVVLKALESNMTLQQLWTERSAYLIHKDRRWRNVEFLLRLNRGKRRILVERSVPIALWPRVLEGVSGDPRLAYYLLREKPEIISTVR